MPFVLRKPTQTSDEGSRRDDDDRIQQVSFIRQRRSGKISIYGNYSRDNATEHLGHVYTQVGRLDDIDEEP